MCEINTKHHRSWCPRKFREIDPLGPWTCFYFQPQSIDIKLARTCIRFSNSHLENIHHYFVIYVFIIVCHLFELFCRQTRKRAHHQHIVQLSLPLVVTPLTPLIVPVQSHITAISRLLRLP